MSLHSLARPMYRLSDEPEAFRDYEARYIEVLQCFEYATLMSAISRVMSSWEFLTWPTPGYIHKFCVEVERENRPLAKPLALPELPPPPEVTDEEAEVMRLKLGRLSKILKNGKIMELDAMRYCESGDYPEHWYYVSKTSGVTSGSDTLESPKPPPTPRQVERAGRLQRRANAARAAYLDTTGEVDHEVAGS